MNKLCPLLSQLDLDTLGTGEPKVHVADCFGEKCQWWWKCKEPSCKCQDRDLGDYYDNKQDAIKD